MSAGSVKDSKICIAEEFFQHLGTRNLLFLGISGSVSYDPGPDDDIDIFIITYAGRLWSTILRAMIVRRIYGLKPICLSLCLDSVSAGKMFDESRDFIVARDSLHVLPIFGDSYYNKLVKGSPLIRKFFPEEFYPNDGPAFTDRRSGLQDFALYLLFSVYLEIKGLLNNHRYEAANEKERCFRTVLGLHRFYLDSLKYQKLRELRPGPGDDDA